MIVPRTKSGVSGQQIFVPYNGKIADITHADTDNHTLDLAAALSETRTIITVAVRPVRVSGTGSLKKFPNEGYYRDQGLYYDVTTWMVIKYGTNRLQYALTDANDDFDVYCFGYVVEA